MSDHIPVMLNEVMAFLKVHDGGTYVDGTFGRGGYTRAILEAANTNVIAIDRDPAALEAAQQFSAIYGSRFTIIPGKFSNMREMLHGRDIMAVDGVVLDLGVSSPQLDDATRGFSFGKNGPLDMRMDTTEGHSARDVVNSMATRELEKIIADLGEERRARRVAEAIAEARQQAPIETTLQLASLIRRVVPKSVDGIDPATRTFQALRLYVNDELGELERALEAAEHLLTPTGKLVCVSFHSLEDRIVKNFLRARSGAAAAPSRHIPVVGNAPAPSFTLLSRSALPPSPEESRANPRSRSARLRAAERTVGSPFPSTATPPASASKKAAGKSSKSRRGS